MNAVDIIILCCFLPAVYTGITHGFIRQLFALAALFLGAYAAYRFSGMLVGFIPESIGLNGQALDIILFILTFLFTMLIVSLVGRLIARLIHIVLLGWLDILLGLVFSLAKAAIVISVLILFVEMLDGLWPFLPEKATEASKLYVPIRNIAPDLFPYIRGFFA